MMGIILGADVKLIIDTDMSNDVDDVLAVGMAFAMEQNGEVDILGIVHDVGLPLGVCGVSVLTEYYGRSADVLIGGYKGDFGRSPSGEWVNGHYLEDLCSNFPSPIKNLSDVADGVSVYRQLLSGAADKSVTIASIGFLTVLSDLVASGPDHWSALNGSALLEAKVSRISVMGGWWPPEHKFGVPTYNFDCGEPFYALGSCNGTTKKFFDALPLSIPVWFSSLGDYTISGAVLTQWAPQNSPVRKALIDQQGENNGRCAWDPLVTMAAIRGVGPMFAEVDGVGGRIRVDQQGANYWINDNKTTAQGYLNYYFSEYEMIRGANARIIDGLLLQPANASDQYN